jgi:hypothetical protein
LPGQINTAKASFGSNKPPLFGYNDDDDDDDDDDDADDAGGKFAELWPST